MPELPAWRHHYIIRPMYTLPTGPWILQGRVLSCVGDEVIEQGFVEIEDGVIKAVGRAAELGTRRAEAIDTGGTLLPGLFNNHAHLAWDGVHSIARQSTQDPPAISAYKSASNMLINLRAGVTTVRDLGVNSTNLFAKQAIEQGIFPGPRLLVCGQAITQTGGHTYWACREISGPDAARCAVREQAGAGADLIKIMACHDQLQFTDAELEALIDEAHRNGIPITAHATFDEAIARVAQFGVDCVEHAGDMSDETIQLLARKNIPIVATFAITLMQSQPEVARRAEIPDWRREQRRRELEDPSIYRGLVKAARAGVAIAFGTDAGPPGVGHDVIVPGLKFLVQVGIVPNQYAAIHSAASVSAQINKLDTTLGTLAAGKAADVIVVDGNPLEDLEALARVRMTFVGGRRMV